MIIQASAGAGAAASAFASNGQTDGGKVSKRLSLINGVAVELKAKWIMRLAKVPGLIVTLDAPVETTAYKANTKSNSQLWPYVSGNAKLWGTHWQPAPDAPTIAIVDSGLDAGKHDFAGPHLSAGEPQLGHAERRGRRGRARHVRGGNRRR